jgi:exopolyphosphatase / guanosine-5'-triphosphate,3'-diphosphate pyrophosphatase
VRIASIDIGTNTLLLLVADVEPPGIVAPVRHDQRIPRLGREVDGKKTILPSVFELVTTILLEYTLSARRCGAEYIVAAATSAVRDADNRQDFLDAVQRTTGISVEVIGGEEEGVLTYLGSLSGIDLAGRSAVVIDIGGGSTEIIAGPPDAGNDPAAIRAESFQIGAVRLTERYFKHNPPLPAEIELAAKEIRRTFSLLPRPADANPMVVGVAGTCTTLAALDQGLTDFDVRAISGYRMDAGKIAGWSRRLLEMSSAEILGLSRAAAGRADILPAGALILTEFMQLSGYNSLIVSERGLRYGLALREWKRLSSS